jgi:hypothetical protein
MNTTRGFLGAALTGALLALVGCGGSGEYRIPNVPPVVKQKPEEDDLLEDIEGNEKPESTKPAPAEAAPPSESKPAEAKPATPAKPSETKPATPPKK